VAYEHYSDLEPSERFLLHALEAADKEVQHRALRMLGHVSWEHRENELKAETQRANNNARRAEMAEKRAREAEEEAARQQDRANRAVGDALAHKERAEDAEKKAENAQERVEQQRQRAVAAEANADWHKRQADQAFQIAKNKATYAGELKALLDECESLNAELFDGE